MRFSVRAAADVAYQPTRLTIRQHQPQPQALTPTAGLGLGIAPGAGIWHAQLTHQHIEALGILFGGLFSATSLMLFALKKDRAGYMLGVAGALTSAFLGAVRVFRNDENKG